MSNYTLFDLTNRFTGEVTDIELPVNNRKKAKYYYGPRSYDRIMQTYDKAQLLLPSKVGIHLMQYLRGEVNLTNYRIQLNATWLAEDLGATREAISKNIAKLVNAGYLIKERRNTYFVSPDMFWVKGMDDKIWQALKQDYITIKDNKPLFKVTTKANTTAELRAVTLTDLSSLGAGAVALIVEKGFKSTMPIEDSWKLFEEVKKLLETK